MKTREAFFISISGPLRPRPYTLDGAGARSYDSLVDSFGISTPFFNMPPFDRYRTVPVVVLFLLCGFSATSLAAQQDPLKLGPLVFGQSGKQELANFLGEKIECVDTPYQYEGTPLRACAPVDPKATDTFAQSFLVDGKVKMVRYLVDPSAQLSHVQQQLADMYGQPVYSGQGQGSRVEGLRFWEYDPGVGCVLLSEVRPARRSAGRSDTAASSRSGTSEPPVRLRISVLDPTDGWVEALPGGFTGCERLGQ